MFYFWQVGLQKGKNYGIILVVLFGLKANAGGGHSLPGYAIDYKFGFDFGVWAKLI